MTAGEERYNDDYGKLFQPHVDVEKNIYGVLGSTPRRPYQVRFNLFLLGTR